MGVRSRKLEIEIIGDDKGISGTFKGVERDAQSFGSKLAGVGKTVALGLGIGLAAVGTAAVSMGGEMLALGGQLDAWSRKVDTVFEGSAEGIRSWADSLNERFGVTDDELAGLAGSFGDLLKPMGFTADQAAGMSKDVIGLAGALSEWSGGQKSASEVAEILSAAMLGERDALQSLGISIAQSEVDARLAAKGQEELTGQARQQAEALATQELLFEKSTDAQRAYAEGGNEALIAQNNLSAKIGELKEQLAEKLAPVLTDLSTWFADKGIPMLEDFAGWLGDNVVPELKSMASWVGDNVTPKLKELSGWFGEHPGAIQVALGLVAGGFFAWAVAAGAAAVATVAATWPVLAIMAAVGLLAGGIIYAYTHWGWFRMTVDGVASSLREYVWPALTTVGRVIRDEVIPAVARVIGFFRNLQNGIWAISGGALGFFIDQLQTVGGTLAWVGEKISQVRDKLSGLKGIAGGIKTGLLGPVGGLLGFDTGGIVPGPIGAPRLAVVHGGETIVPTHDPAAMGRYGGGGRGDTYLSVEVHVHGSIHSTDDIIDAINDGIRRGKPLQDRGRVL